MATGERLGTEILERLIGFLKFVSKAETMMNPREQKHFWNGIYLAIRGLPKEERNAFRELMYWLIRELNPEAIN